MDNRLSRLLAWPEIVVVVVIGGLSFAGGGYSSLALGAATVLVWLLILAVLLGGWAEPGQARQQIVAAALCLMTLAGFTAFSLIWASDDGSGFSDVVRVTGYAGAFILAGLTVRPGRAMQALTAVAAGVFTVALIALGSRLGGIGGGDAGLVSLLSSTGGRLSYPIGYWNALGALMALGVPLLVWIATEGHGPRPRGWALAGICPPLLVAYMTSSRGALLASLVGAAVVVHFATDRPKAAAATAVAVLAALPAICASSLMSGILDSAGTGTPGTSELVVAVALLAGMALACEVGGGVAARLSRFRFRRFRLRARLVISVTLVFAVGLIVLTGPGRFVDDFRTVPAQKRADVDAGVLTVSGSGRAQFWGTAIEAFADEPVKGIGAGDFPTYWNVHGSLDTPTKNAHSEPLELLAELGLVGLAAFLAFFVVVVRAGIPRARGPGGGPAGAALGVVAAGSVGFLIDWTWQIPAVVVPVLIAAAVLTGSAFQTSIPVSGGRHRGAGLRLGRWRGPAIVATLIAAAIPAVWAGGVLALASSHLDASGDALDRGEYGQAAQSARAAAAIEPWAAEPWLQLATIEQRAGNLEAARLDAAASIDRAPEDFRPWLLAVLVEAKLGNGATSITYWLRAQSLAPLLLQRVVNVGLAVHGTGF